MQVRQRQKGLNAEEILQQKWAFVDTFLSVNSSPHKQQQEQEVFKHAAWIPISPRALSGYRSYSCPRNISSEF